MRLMMVMFWLTHEAEILNMENILLIIQLLYIFKLQNTSKAIGQLVLIYKRVTSLAAFTSRVSEILESVSLSSSIIIDMHSVRIFLLV